MFERTYLFAKFVYINLNHSPQKFVDLVLAITEVTALNVVIGLLAPSAVRGV